jgi:pyruvate dehydrogenase E2 component (dihydrolipoamide acetyltransferase)
MQEEGFIARILYPDGAKDVPLGEALAILVDDEKDIHAFADWVAGGVPDEPTVEAAAEITPEAFVPTGSLSKAQSGDRQFVSPIAARIAKEKGLDLATVNGTGPNSRIILADVEEALKAGPVQVAQDVVVHKTAAAVPQAAAAKKAAAPQKVEMPNGMF